MEHHLPSHYLQHRMHIQLVGCGGNGSQMLTGLARLDHALRALGQPGFHVTAFDPDTVSPANVGRQLFSPGDAGRNKAVVLINRLNTFFGINWDAEPEEFGMSDRACDMLISCVDTRAARHFIDYALTQSSYMKATAAYWMDLGNRAEDGQVVLGCPAKNKRYRNQKSRLPTVAELLPEIIDTSAREDNTPSCSLAEALQRQHLFVNQAVTTAALQILWQLFRTGRIDWHGAFVNLRSGRSTPLPVDPEAWARMRTGPVSKSNRKPKPTTRSSNERTR